MSVGCARQFKNSDDETISLTNVKNKILKISCIFRQFFMTHTPVAREGDYWMLITVLSIDSYDICHKRWVVCRMFDSILFCPIYSGFFSSQFCCALLEISIFFYFLSRSISSPVSNPFNIFVCLFQCSTDFYF